MIAPFNPPMPDLPGGGVAFGHQHVAIGQDVYPARMRQIARERGHRPAIGGDGQRIVGPADGRSDLQGRDEALIRRNDAGRCTGIFVRHEERAVAACDEARTGKHQASNTQCLRHQGNRNVWACTRSGSEMHGILA